MLKSKNVLPTPSFTKTVVQDNRTDGYWIETFWVDPKDKVPGLIGYGMASGDICVFDNPINGGPKSHDGIGWRKILVKKFDSPVAVVTADCAGNGRKDVVACYDYGPTFMDCNPNGGNISWLENPGRQGPKGEVAEDWKIRYIGRWPAMHRLKAGYFTQKSILEIIALSVVHGPQDIETPIPVILFQKPEKSLDAIEWTRSIIDDEHFSVVHDAAMKKFDGQNGRDSLFLASREGINWLYWENQEWKVEHIHDGMPKEAGKDYYGSACVDVGKTLDDPAAYIATIDPFHGTTVTFLTKDKTGPASAKWIRNIADVYGDPDQLKNTGTGPGHYVITGDFDGDGVDECLVALFGPSPYEGVYYYKPIDLEKGVFAKWKVADESAGRIAVGDFGGDGKLDFATISYNVPLYYEAPNPKIYLYSNDFCSAAYSPEPQVVSTVWGGEPLYYLPKPTEVTAPSTVPLMEVAGYRIDLEILPPNWKVTTFTADPIKVIFGGLYDGSIVRRALNVPQFEKSDATLSGGPILTKEEGVIFLRFTSTMDQSERNWKAANEVPVKSLIEFSYQQLELPADLKFTKVEDLPWGGDFKGLEFYNMSGIDFRFLDKTELVHVQFWTAAKDVNCGVHDHDDKIFLEVHLSLSNGTGNGGMWRVKDGVVVDPEHANDLPDKDFDKLPLAPGEQHGGMWERDTYDKPIYRENGTPDYPWHKWQAGNTGNSIDVWTAFEFNPKLEY